MTKSRRHFIKKTAMAGAAMSLPYSSFAGRLAKGKKVKLGVVGTGGRGCYLIKMLLNQPDQSEFDIIAICDNYKPHLDNAKVICNTYKNKPKTYLDYAKLVKENSLDGVIISTPLHQHAHIAIDFMKAGVHILCEKSMARTLDDTKAMYDTHKATGSILLIGHQRMFNARYLHAMKRLHKGDFGQIGQIKAYWHRNADWRRPLPNGDASFERQINWRLYKQYSAGLLTELMSHQLQVANWALQQTPDHVQASGSIQFWKDGREVPDNMAAIFSYADGTKFIYDSMNMNRNFGCEEHIIADYGTMRLESNKLLWDKPNQITAGGTAVAKMVDDIKNGEFKKAPVGGSTWNLEKEMSAKENIYDGQKGDGTLEQLMTFIQFIKNKSVPEWMIREAYNASAWTLVTEKAIDSGEKESLPEKYRI